MPPLLLSNLGTPPLRHHPLSGVRSCHFSRILYSCVMANTCSFFEVALARFFMFLTWQLIVQNLMIQKQPANFLVAFIFEKLLTH